MSGGMIKKQRRAKIKQQLKEQKASKIAAELKEQIVNMTDQELDELSTAIGEILLENDEKKEVEE